MKKVLVLAGIGGYLFQMDPRIHVEFNESKKMNEILDKCPSLQNFFYPCPWLFNGIFQGFYGMGPGSSSNLTENTDFVEYEREFIQLKDSGLMSIDWKSPRQKTDKILLIIPGLSGGSHSEYIRTAVLAASDEGFDVGVIHGRGIAGTPIKVPCT
jgi:predicted alpha/beta-fold hydrolase